MSSKLKVGIKFCGNCNPHIPTSDIYRRITDNIENINELELVSKDSTGLDILIVISGCAVDCATRPQGAFQEIVIAGESIDRLVCKIEEIPEEVTKKIRNLCLRL